MSERKVLNKYYPPDFNPRLLPRKTKEQKFRQKQYEIRIMAPCNMKCTTCGEYIYKGRKFNSRQERMERQEDAYLGIKQFRFYIKCTRCMSEIVFRSDLESEDYIIEHGATRNFQAYHLAQLQAEKEHEKKKQEEEDDPMMALEKRTKDSRSEMERLEALEEIRDINQRLTTVDHEDLLKQNVERQLLEAKRQEDEDDAYVKSLFGKTSTGESVKRIRPEDDDSESSDSDSESAKKSKTESNWKKPESTPQPPKPAESNKPSTSSTSWEKSIGSISQSSILTNVIRKKPAEPKKTDVEPKQNLSGLASLADYGSSDDSD